LFIEYRQKTFLILAWLHLIDCQYSRIFYSFSQTDKTDVSGVFYKTRRQLRYDRVSLQIYNFLRGISHVHDRVDYFAPKRTYNEPLTAREQQVIAAMVDGLSYKMIAVRPGITLETVRQHIKNIYRKLQVNNKTEVIVKSLKGVI
jgi:DNA-binding CsgD family transcriptional regulator